jgi:deaminated glutathione amidase
MVSVTVSCIQTNAAPLLRDNLKNVTALIRDAKKQGAELVVLPENVGCMARTLKTKLAQAAAEENHEGVHCFSAIAKELGLWIVGGSLSIHAANDKMTNRSLVFRPDGTLAARYDKIHLYDADPKAGETYRESHEIIAGDTAVITDTPWGKLGLTICYDLRFPHLYRALAQAGAVMITVPAAFTQTTGEAHWHVLLRARAIETGCYILAAAQTGEHEGNRKTYGHSVIISPWGDIIADAGVDVGIITTTINLEKVADARNAIPALLHDKDFILPK